jgi:hypothetical protein
VLAHTHTQWKQKVNPQKPHFFKYFYFSQQWSADQRLLIARKCVNFYRALGPKYAVPAGRP